MLLQIKRNKDNIIAREISSIDSKRELGNISKYNYIISDENPRYKEVADLLNNQNQTNKRKLISLINELYKIFADKYPQYVKSVAIPYTIVNDKYALYRTKDYIKLVLSNNRRSDRGRVHISIITKNEFVTQARDSILYRKDNEYLYNKWSYKIEEIFNKQLNKYIESKK